jgi:regulator of cell morphogenesis and NO signaling
MSLLETTVGQLVAEEPSRGPILERLGIDYCCGGKRTLAEASAAQKLDPQAVLAALQAGADAPGPVEKNWSQAALTELADHIEATHHAYLRAELPKLSERGEQVLRVHGANHPELAEVRDVFQALRAELEAHMEKEEFILFPMIRDLEAGQGHVFHCGSLRNPIGVMEAEHEAAAEALAKLRRLTADYTPPGDACSSFRSLLAGLAAFDADLHQHVHKENNILFPRAIAAEQAALGAAG